jgi:hypothetical protein
VHVNLPHASAESIAKIAELARLTRRRHRPRELGSGAGLAADGLLRLVDALTSLGYATLTNGRLNLTETGARLADANLQRAYAFFREGALERVPLVRGIRRARALG